MEKWTKTRREAKWPFLLLFLWAALPGRAFGAFPPPIITVPPLDQIVQKGGTATFSVVATSITTLGYQWFFGSTAISGATSSTLVRTNVSYAMAGQYMVAVSNAGGTVNSPSASLVVLNTAPVSLNDSYNATEDTLLTVPAPGVLANDTDINGDTLKPVLASGPSHGTLNLNANGSFTYLAATNYNGTDSFTYQAYDGMALGNVATVTITIAAVNDPPIAYNQTISLPNYASTNITLHATDVDSPVLTYSILSGPTNGALAAAFDTVSGNVTYTPASNYSGSDGFVFAVSDGSLSATGRVSIIVLAPPAIVTQPQSQTLLAGQTASFSVSASGSAPLAYQWLLEGSPITGATSSTLSLSNVQPANAGNYSVQIQNAVGVLTSAVATLTVYVPPFITAQPTNQALTFGTDLTLSVAASGTMPLTYQWLFAGTNLDGATDPTLVVTNVQFPQTGRYQVIVSNIAGIITSAVARVTIVVPPGTDSPLASGMVLHLTFDGDLTDSSGRGNHGKAVGAPNIIPGCIGSGSLNPFSSATNQNYVTLGRYSDLNFGTNSDFSIAFWARQPPGSWGGSSYYNPVYIANKDWSSDWNVGWVLSSEAFSATGPVDIWCNYTEPNPPNLRTSYHSPPGSFAGDSLWHHLTVTFQRTGSMSTYIDGVLAGKVNLRSNGKTVDAGLPVNIGTDGTGAYDLQWGYWTNAFGFATNGLALDDLGIWRRVLSPQEIGAIYNAGLVGMDFGTVTSNQLTTVISPRITQQPASQNVIAGNDTSLTVQASGTSPSYQWFQDGSPLVGGTSATLTLSNVAPAAAGNYWVVVSNAAASATSITAAVTVTIPPPPQILTLDASSVGPVSAQLNASVNTQGAPTLCWFEYGLDTNYGSLSSTVTLPSASSNSQFAAAVTGLAPATTYHFHVVASNAGGTTAGEDLTFTTAPVPPFQVSSISGPQSGTIQLSLTSVSGTTFTVLSASDLSIPLTNWTVIGVMTEVTSGQYQYTGPATNPASFFTVRSP